MSINEHVIDLECVSQAAAVQAGAITPCRAHPSVMINQCEPDAERRAYAIATVEWKAERIICSREELMDAVKDAIEQSCEECPICAEILDA